MAKKDQPGRKQPKNHPWKVFNPPATKQQQLEDINKAEKVVPWANRMGIKK
jgi:hypothetical protein